MTGLVGSEEDPLPVIRAHRGASVRVVHRLVRDGEADAAVTSAPRPIASAGAVFGLGLMKGATAPTFASVVGTGELRSLLVEAEADSGGDDLLAQQALGGIAIAPVILGFGAPVIGVVSAVDDADVIAALSHLLPGCTVEHVGAQSLITGVGHGGHVLVADPETAAFAQAVARSAIDAYAESLQMRAEAELTGDVRDGVLALLAASLAATEPAGDGDGIVLGVDGVSVLIAAAHHASADVVARVRDAILRAAALVDSDVCATLRTRLASHIELRRADAGLGA